MTRQRCGGCDGLGAHWRWCPAVIGETASRYGQLADQAESLGDRVGGNDPGTANLLYAAAGRLRELAEERTTRGARRDGGTAP